ncbi:apolipoprotein N-acyltransferase [Marinomonas sp. 15G1-11]|uniref:Apolipoprotein N-acyltransferase n=1 Tax=Marinomonas phaeophyticola TaxID=3004091 RepID=A0ABT4JQ94_9GAMM|nr:apolipoprotein N-acyltransferase [Marinomonas sp. 15G1-11]MCZ2720548.1 apolipoprotein N-acyltransferase [Marinomonas sp. 15G1-11]
MRTLFQPFMEKRFLRLFFIGIIAGALSVFAFAPFSFWPAIATSIAGFSWLLSQSKSHREAAWFGFSIGLGYFGAGVSWIFVSIANYGQVGLALSLFITFAFITVLSTFNALAGYLCSRLFLFTPTLSKSFIISLTFLFTEYLRSHLFTGFPWLLAGYSMEKSPLFELSPIGGIWLLTFACLLSFSVPISLFLAKKDEWKKEMISLLAVILLWGTGVFLSINNIQWVIEKDTIKTTLVQGNLKQNEKWLVEQASKSLSYYQSATMDHLDSDLVIWPETAITYLYHQVENHLKPFQHVLMESNTTLITGIPYYNQENERYHNSIWAMGEGFGLYFKQRLVPFGEYVPFANYVGKLLDLFGMPMSTFSAGERNQPVLQAREWGVAAFICYEIVYPELVRSLVKDSDFLITVSNDGWFGDSFGPVQHLQIAQFRAKETGRYVVRSTNTGISAIIDHNGHITAQAPQFIRTTLTAPIKTTMGTTPYVQYGNLVVITLILLMVLLQGLSFLQKTKQ